MHGRFFFFFFFFYFQYIASRTHLFTLLNESLCGSTDLRSSPSVTCSSCLPTNRQSGTGSGALLVAVALPPQTTEAMPAADEQEARRDAREHVAPAVIRDDAKVDDDDDDEEEEEEE